MTIFLIIIFILFLIIVAYGLRIVNQYQKGVVFRLGRVRHHNIKEPGLRVIIPIIDKIKKVSLRTVTLPVESQKIITKDNVSIDVAAVAYYNVNDPIKSIVEIENVQSAIYQIAQTTVRNVVGQSMLDEVLSSTSKINDKIKIILESTVEKWGILVSMVELKDIKLPESLQQAMAKQAQAERDKRAMIINAEGEQLSAAKLAEAADIIAAHPIALQLRNLQVLSDIAVEKNSTVIFPSQFLDTVDSVKKFMAKES